MLPDLRRKTSRPLGQISFCTTGSVSTPPSMRSAERSTPSRPTGSREASPKTGGASQSSRHSSATQSTQGGLNLSSQHWVEGRCDGGSAAFGSGSAGQTEVAWSAACGAAGAPAAVLGIYRRGVFERGRGDAGGGNAGGWGPVGLRGGGGGAR